MFTLLSAWVQGIKHFDFWSAAIRRRFPSPQLVAVNSNARTSQRVKKRQRAAALQKLPSCAGTVAQVAFCGTRGFFGLICGSGRSESPSRAR